MPAPPPDGGQFLWPPRSFSGAPDPVDDLQNIVGRAASAPGHMPVGAHQNQRVFIQLPGLFGRDAVPGERHAALGEAPCERIRVDRLVEAHQHEALPVIVQGRDAVLHPGVRRPAPGPGRGLVVHGVVGRLGRAVGTANGRVAVAIPKLYALGREFAAPLLIDQRGHFRPRPFSLDGGAVEFGVGDNQLVQLVVVGGFRRVSQRDGPALGLVAGQQVFPAPARQRGGYLPAQVDGIADSRIRAESAFRPSQVGGIAGQQDPVQPIAFGHDHMPGPGLGLDDLDLHVHAQRGQHGRQGVDLLAFLHVHGKTPQFLAVDGGQVGAAWRVDGMHLEERGAVLGDDAIQQVGRAEEGGEVAALRERAGVFDADFRAGLAVSAVAGDQVLSAYRAAGASIQIGKRGSHAGFVLDEILQPCVVADGSGRFFERRVPQQRIENSLGADDRTFGGNAVGRGGDFLIAQAREGGQHPAVQRREEADVQRIVAWEFGRKAGALRQPPAPEVLHGPGKNGFSRRESNLAVFLVDQHVADVPVVELVGQGQAYGPPADDQYRDFLASHGVHLFAPDGVVGMCRFNMMGMANSRITFDLCK